MNGLEAGRKQKSARYLLPLLHRLILYKGNIMQCHTTFYLCDICNGI